MPACEEGPKLVLLGADANGIVQQLLCVDGTGKEQCRCLRTTLARLARRDAFTALEEVKCSPDSWEAKEACTRSTYSVAQPLR